MHMISSKKTVISNMMWRFAERCGAQGVSFVVSIILARLLLPEEYGVVSLITIFTTILNLFIDSGFKNALIQKRDADQTDFSTVFYFNIFMGMVLYFLMFFCGSCYLCFLWSERYGSLHTGDVADAGDGRRQWGTDSDCIQADGI